MRERKLVRRIPDRLKEIQTTKAEMEIEQHQLLNAALKSGDPSTILKANVFFNEMNSQNKVGQSRDDFKSYFIDPYSLYQSLGFRNRPFSVSYDTLRNLAKSPIIRAIIGTRVEQVASFAEPQEHEHKIGWMIRKKRRLYEKITEITDEEKEKIWDITNFISNGGHNTDEEDFYNAFDGDTFEMFLRKVVADSLILDQMTFEVVDDKMERPTKFLATDAATFRIAETMDKSEKGKIKHGQLPKFVQLLNGTVNAEFHAWELCFGIRNLSTNIYSNGYGRSESEDLIRIITWMLYGDAYNGKFFSQGAAPKGILKLSGNINDARLMEFKQLWQAQIAGVNNAWKTPVLEADKMEWVDLQKTNQDMQFQHWQEYLIKLSCAVYKMDPSEIGFPMQGSMASQAPMFEGSSNAKLEYSQEKGLKPLMRFLQRKINQFIVNRLDSDYEFIWTGLDPENEEKRLEADIKKIGNFMGYKEIREARGLPRDVKDDDMILNGMYFQMKQQEKQEKQQNTFQNNQFGGGNPFESKPGEEQPEEEQQNNEEQINKEEENPFMKSFNQWVDVLIEKNK